MYNFIKKSKTWFTKSRYSGRLAMVFGIVLVGVFVVTNPVSAQVGDWIVGVASGAVQIVVDSVVDLYLFFVGSLLTSILIPVLVGIAQYNGFISNPIVATGWALTRDLANVFFIIVLLVIAFSTMLRLQTYHYKQALSKLILMIVLVNFSKVISGVLIDFFQILMLTFVNGFKTALGGNFITAFHIYDMLAFAQTSAVVAGGTDAAKSSADWQITGALVLAAVGITVVTMTVLIMIAVLLYRIVMIWILVVLSPLAYFAYTIRPNYWSQWWSEFFKNLVSGPAIAFFLWLALLTAQTGQIFTLDAGIDINKGTEDGTTLGSAFAMPSVMMNFMAMTALMIGGLVVSQKMAAQSGAAVGNFANKVRSVGTKAMMIGTGASAVGLMGKGLAAPVKGTYDWGARRVKAFQGMRDSIKSERAGKTARFAMDKYAKLKQNTAGKVGKVTSSLYEKASGKSELDKLTAEMAPYQSRKRRAKGNNTRDIEAEKKVEELQERKNTLLKSGRYRVLDRVVGRAGMNHMLETFKNVGVDEGHQVRSARYSEVAKFDPEMKTLNGREAEDIFRDESQDKNRRMSAMFRMMEEGDGDVNDAEYYRDFVKRNGGNDKLLNSKLESIIDMNDYAGASTRMKGKRFETDEKGNFVMEEKQVLNDTTGKMETVMEKDVKTGEMKPVMVKKEPNQKVFEYQLGINAKKLGTAAFDELGEVGSIKKVFTDETGQHVDAARFGASIKGMSTQKRDFFLGELRKSAGNKHTSEDSRRKDLEMMVLMGEVGQVLGQNGLIHELEATTDKDGNAVKPMMERNDINTVVRHAFNSDKSQALENTAEHLENFDIHTQAHLSGNDNEKNKSKIADGHYERIIGSGAMSSFMTKISGKLGDDHIIETVEADVDEVFGGDQDVKNDAVAAAIVFSGKVEYLSNIEDEGQKKDVTEKVVKRLKPLNLVTTKFNRGSLEDDDRELLIKTYLDKYKGKEDSLIDDLITADNAIAAEGRDREHINSLLGKMREIIEKEPDSEYGKMVKIIQDKGVERADAGMSDVGYRLGGKTNRPTIKDKEKDDKEDKEKASAEFEEMIMKK